MTGIGIDRGYVSHRGIVVNESNAYVQCGVAGFGILQAPGITLERSLVEVLENYRPRPRPVSVLYPSRTHLVPQVQAFVDWVSQRFALLYPVWLEK